MSAAKPDTIESAYLGPAFDRKRVAAVIESFKAVLAANAFGDFDAIAVRGMSGMLFGPLLAYETGKSLIIVRKPHEGSHTRKLVEGHTHAPRAVIVDDFVASGGTLATIAAHLQDRTKIAGAYLWAGDADWAVEKMENNDDWHGVPVAAFDHAHPHYVLRRCRCDT